MVQEAEKHAAEDEHRRRLIEARNQADHVIYETEKSLGSYNGQVPASQRQELEAKIAELKEAMNGEDAGRIQQLTQEVQQASMAIGQAVHQAGNGASASGEAGGESDDEDIVEGEFEAA
jgi:molecular chaperone DnaK